MRCLGREPRLGEDQEVPTPASLRGPEAPGTPFSECFRGLPAGGCQDVMWGRASGEGPEDARVQFWEPLWSSVGLWTLTTVCGQRPSDPPARQRPTWQEKSRFRSGAEWLGGGRRGSWGVHTGPL